MRKRRYPNDAPAIRTLGGLATDATSKERVATWRDPAGAVLHALHGGRWGGVHVPILGKNPDGSLRFGAETGNNCIAPEAPQQMYPTAAALVSALQARRFQAYVDLIVVRDQKRRVVKLQVQ